MERRLIPGIEVEHAGQRWCVYRALGPDAVLLRDPAGEVVSADPARIDFPADDAVGRPAMPAPDERRYRDVAWQEAARRRARSGRS